MLRIGMIGEFPTDIMAVKNLLIKRFEDLDFFPLVYDIHGSSLENPKIKSQLRREYQIEKPDYVLFVRDLDGHESDKDRMQKRKDYFAEFNSVVDKKGFLLLHIQELEAVLLSDVSVLNSHYGVSLDPIDNCMEVPSPKEYLKARIKEFSQGDNPMLFGLYDIDRVIDNCSYFRRFIQIVDPHFALKKG